MEHFQIDFIKDNIPTEFRLFATTIKVRWDNTRMNQKNSYGEFRYCRAQITLSTTAGVVLLDNDRIKDCFYHEKIHAILEMMKEDELSENEKFVDTFAKLLRQSDETSLYGMPIPELNVIQN